MSMIPEPTQICSNYVVRVEMVVYFIPLDVFKIFLGGVLKQWEANGLPMMA